MLAALVALTLVAQAPAPAPAAQVRGRVVLVALGSFPGELLDDITAQLQSELQVEVVRAETLALPKEAYYPPRKRYRADELLRFLEKTFEHEPKGTRVLGMTSVDISTTKGDIKDWGVFGLGDMPGTACVLSVFRLKGHLKSEAHLRFRVSSVAVHEVGHTFGLDHCEEARCVMQDAEGTIKTVDTSTGKLGPSCRAKLDALAPLSGG